MTDDAASTDERVLIHQTGCFPGMYEGMSTNDYTALLTKRRWSHEAKGRILMFPRTGIVAVPFEMTGTGWYCAPLHDPAGIYPPSGYSIYVGSAEIETAIEHIVDWSSVVWA